MRKLRLLPMSLVVGSSLWVSAARPPAQAARAGAGTEQKSPALKIAGAPGAEGIKVNSSVTGFNHSIAVEETAASPVEGLRVVVAPLVASDGVQVAVKCLIDRAPCSQGPVGVPALGALSVTISADLPREDVYTGAVTLVYADKRETTKLTVTRVRPPLPAEVLGLEVARASGVNDDPSVWLTVSCTSGRALSLSPPAVTALSRSGANSSRTQAQFSGIKVVDESGAEIKDVWELKPGSNSHLRLSVLGLSEPGEYTGNVRLSAADMQPVDKPFTILVKSSWPLAALFIGSGVAIGFLLKRYATRERPRILQQRRALVLLSEVDAVEAELGALEEAEKGVIQTFRRRLNDQYEEIALGAEGGADEALGVIDRQLTAVRAWVNARRRVEALRPAALGDPFRVMLKTVEDYLSSKQPGAAAEAAAQKILSSVAEQIDQALRDDLAARLKEFRKEVEQFRQAATAAFVIDAIGERLAGKIEDAEAALRAGRLRQAREDYDGARGTYVHLLADDLESRLGATPPLGFDDATWQGLRAKVSAELALVRQQADADAATAAYRSAHSLYMLSLTAALRRAADQYRALLSQDVTGLFTEADFREHSGRLAAVVRRLDDAVREVHSGAFPAAASSYADAVKSFDELTQALSKGGLMQSEGAEQTHAGAPPAGSIPEAVGEARARRLAPRAPRALTTIEDLERRLRRYDLYSTLGVGVIAVALGLQILWVENATWGGLRDCLTAVLWGLGLHQVGGVAFEGLLGLKDRLSNVKPG